MVTLPVTVTVTDKNGQQAQSVGGSVTPGGPALVNVGEITILPNKDSGAGNLLIAIPIALTSTGVINSLSIYIDGGSGSLQLALYSNVSGKPGAKIAETVTFTSVVGWNIHATTTTPSSPSGNYFLVFNYNSNTLVFCKASTGGTSYLSAAAFGSMPATFPANPTSTGSHWSLYGTFLEGSVPTIWVNSVAPGGVVPPGGGGGGGGFPATFMGNPNVTISSIGGAPVFSRTSGEVPLYIQVSGSGVTAGGTSKPFEDLEFSSDGGDPSADTMTDWYTNNGTTGQTVSTNSQVKPEPVVCYRSPGTYTFTFRARGPNGSGGYTTKTWTQTITATAFNASGGDVYYDSAAAGGGDGSIGAPFNDLSTVNTKLGIDRIALHFKRGSSFTTSTGWVSNIDLTGMRIDAYGSGADPIILLSGGGDADYSMSMQSARNRANIVISGIHFSYAASAGGTSHQAQIKITTSGTYSDIYLDTLNVTSTDANRQGIDLGSGFSTLTQFVRGGTWNCTVTWTGTPSGSISNIGPLSAQWGFIFGGTLGGDGTSTTFDHHIYPQTRQHLSICHVNFQTAAGKNYCINTNCDNLTGNPGSVSQWVCYSNNNFTGVVYGWDASCSDSPATTEGFFKDFVVQQSLAHDLSGRASFFDNCSSMTVRDINLWGNGSTQINIAINAAFYSLQMQIYRTKTFIPSGSAGGQDTAQWCYDIDAPWSVAQNYTDNITQDDRASANVVEGGFSNWQAAGSIINRNSYYTKNNNTGIWYNAPLQNGGGTQISQATWQGFGFDATITWVNAANPSWSNPAAGVFQ